jgi:hypothetical protein
MDVRFRPYAWVGEQTPAAKKRRSPFSTSWNKTLAKLENELTKLRASEIIIEADFTEEAIRLDGWPRATAKPGYGGVKISFNQPGVGRVEYPCDSCISWQDNIHSIALGLEALRAVERYGITGRMQQYTGFRALEASNGAMSKMKAAGLIVALSDRAHTPELASVILRDREMATKLYRIALKRWHPDQGGDRKKFDQLQEAYKVLSAS